MPWRGNWRWCGEGWDWWTISERSVVSASLDVPWLPCAQEDIGQRELVEPLLIRDGGFFRKPVVPIGIMKTLFPGEIVHIAGQHPQLKHVYPWISAPCERTIGAKDHLFNRQDRRNRVHPNECDNEIAKDVSFAGLKQCRDETDKEKNGKDHRVRREKLLRNLEENEEIIHGFFSKIKPALRKMPFLGGGSNNKLIDDYLMDALKTFHQDNHLEIIKILQQLKKALADEQIKLDADQANQIYEFLEKAEQGYLLELKNKHKELQDELEGLQNFSNNKDFQMKIGEAKYRVEHYHQQVERFQEEFESVQNELKEQMTLLQKEIEHFKSTVKISLDQEIEINI